MNITEVQDDSKVWRRGAAGDPEVVELIKQMRSWEIKKTFEVKLDKPVKSLGAILKREFKDDYDVDAKRKDETNTTWYLRIDVAQVKKSRTRKPKVSIGGDVNKTNGGQPVNN